MNGVYIFLILSSGETINLVPQEQVSTPSSTNFPHVGQNGIKSPI